MTASSGSMLRASSFCRARSETSLSVRLEIEYNAPPTSNCCLATISLLQKASLIQGKYIWIEFKKKKIGVELLLASTEEEEETEFELSSPVLRISALAAANLGLLSYSLSQSAQTTQFGKLIPCRDVITEADHVLLQYYGRPVEDIEKKRRQQQKQTNNAIHTTDETTDAWPLPAADTLLQISTIIRLENNSFESIFYQVLRINNGTVGDRLCKCTATTTFSLQAPSFSSCPRLPSFSTKLPPHPNLKELSDFIRASAASRPAECVFHICGNDSQHHVHELVQATASHLGRRLVVLPRGWAAFSFESNGSIQNGGLADKLNGLQAALDKAKQHIPALLHIYFDANEFSVHDQEQFHDEQSRIWSMIIQELACCSYEYRNDGSVVPLVIVLSTESTLGAGPLIESLVFESLQAVTPDHDYIQHMWQGIPYIEQSEVQEILKGRPACEIETLKDKFTQATTRLSSTASTNDDGQDVVLLLQTLAHQLDKQRRTGLARIPQVQWSDVGGLASVRREIMDTISLPLKYPHLFPGKRSGILLYGPPGTGKTLVAKAVATECNLPFLSIKGPELLGSYVGESEENVRTIFAQARQLARQNQPPASILFFDELDSLAPRRGDQASGGGSVMDRVVATLFAELDKKQSDCSVYCMGATNRPDLLDSALLRPGRLDRLVYLGMPSSEDQVMILAAQMRQLTLEGDAIEMARQVVGFIPSNVTGADLSTVASKALLQATERLCDQADQELKAKQTRKSDTDPLVVSMDDLLDTWDTDKLTPVVTLSDLLLAAQGVVPSVSADELAGYERLRHRFHSQSSSFSKPVETKPTISDEKYDK